MSVGQKADIIYAIRATGGDAVQSAADAAVAGTLENVKYPLPAVYALFVHGCHFTSQHGNSVAVVVCRINCTMIA